MKLIVILFMTILSFSCHFDLPVLGVTETLAKERTKQVSSVAYALHLSIPDQKNDPIMGSVEINFHKQDHHPLILDFKGNEKQVFSVKWKDKALEFTYANGHLIIKSLPAGSIKLTIEFEAGDGSLNRSEDYLYTLLVPDRASTVFPCFDQPDLKARYTLKLSIPKDWVAVGNGALKSVDSSAERAVYSFQETLPVSTYLFAFAAGKFLIESSSDGPGGIMRMYHRETDTLKVKKNAPELFALHAQSLRWMENYTGIKYPFNKLDFVLLPAFQYGGMEHIGAIFYKSSSLLLDEQASEAQLLGRASLIAHETAHMWFGDLVTMKWFNDVWLKEVFANFFAAKMVNPQFPEVNHELRFLVSHHTSAYAEDRTEGSHPIQQPLENLLEAGSLYGNIIYTKAPVVMRQLEERLGEKKFQAGLQTYLQEFSYANATWDDLISILDQQTPEDLASWSNAWVKQAHLPKYHLKRLENDRGFQITAVNKPEAGESWAQHLELVFWNSTDSIIKKHFSWAGDSDALVWPDQNMPVAFVANGTPSAYGYFALDDLSLAWLSGSVNLIQDETLRGIVYLNLYEEFLHGRIPPHKYLALLLQGISTEKNIQINGQLINQLHEIFWHYLSKQEQQEKSILIEQLLRFKLEQDSLARNKMVYWRAWSQMALSEQGLQDMYEFWSGHKPLPGIQLSINEQANLAVEIILRHHPNTPEILEGQAKRFTNPDEHQRWEFLRRALSPEERDRVEFFNDLKEEKNRHFEPWVQDGLSYLHHPLRAQGAIQLIAPALELLEEIQRTGDIFFPKRWISAVLQGHSSPQAAREVRTFISQHPDYPYRLKNKILQAADPLFRRAELKK